MFYKVEVNLKVFPIRIVRTAINSMLDRGYFLLDGDKKRLIVHIKSKKEDNLNLEFKNQLINYFFYYSEFEKTKNLKEIILARTILTNNPDYFDEVLFDDDI